MPYCYCNGVWLGTLLKLKTSAKKTTEAQEYYTFFPLRNPTIPHDLFALLYTHGSCAPTKRKRGRGEGDTKWSSHLRVGMS